MAGKAVLDAGCGTASRLADAVRGSAALAIGVDLVPAMLARGRAQAASGGYALLAGDVRTLPLADARFDVVWCRLVLGYVADIAPAYRELARVTRAGAALIVTDLHAEAARRGHRRTFRDAAGISHDIDFFVHEADEHHSAAQAVGFAPDGQVELTAGPMIEGFYEEAGMMELYREHRRLRLVLGLRFVRGPEQGRS